MRVLTANVLHRTAVLIAAAFAGLIMVVCWINFTDPRAVDFVSYWAAAQLALEGRSEAIYDIAAHAEVERTAAPLRGLMPFPYPPPFLLVTAPFGLLPYGLAFAAWVVITAMLYVAAASRHIRPACALAFPAVLSNGLIGQNGFLTSAVFLLGTKWLDLRPVLSGAVLGLMVIKPQLGVLLPIALIAGRHWLVITAATISSACLLIGALLAFGIGAYGGFLDILPVYAGFISAGRWPWNELASPFAFARYWGLSAPAALAIHTTIALAAAVTVWRAWRLGWNERLPILAAATVLIPPYLFSYDALLLALPLASLALGQRRSWLVPIVWLLSALPVAANFGLFAGPNTLPLAAILLLVATAWDRVRHTPGSGSQ